LILEQFEKVDDKVYSIAKDIAIKYPDAARLAYKSLKLGVEGINMHAYGFEFTPHNNWYKKMLTPTYQFKKKIMYEFGFRLLQCLFNSYAKHAICEMYEYVKHVNTCLSRGYVTKLAWNDPNITIDVDKAIKDLIRSNEFIGITVEYELYDKATNRDQLFEVLTFYHGIYIYKYLEADTKYASTVMNKIKRLANNNPTIIPSVYLHEVAANIALSYDIYDPQYNPYVQRHEAYTRSHLRI
jgi:hypothetical protein